MLFTSCNCDGQRVMSTGDLGCATRRVEEMAKRDGFAILRIGTCAAVLFLRDLTTGDVAPYGDPIHLRMLQARAAAEVPA